MAIPVCPLALSCMRLSSCSVNMGDKVKARSITEQTLCSATDQSIRGHTCEANCMNLLINHTHRNKIPWKNIPLMSNVISATEHICPNCFIVRAKIKTLLLKAVATIIKSGNKMYKSFFLNYSELQEAWLLIGQGFVIKTTQVIHWLALWLVAINLYLCFLYHVFCCSTRLFIPNFIQLPISLCLSSH